MHDITPDLQVCILKMAALDHLLQVVFKSPGIGDCQPGRTIQISQMGDLGLNAPAHEWCDQIPLGLTQGGHKVVQPVTFMTKISANFFNMRLLCRILN